MPAIAKIRFTNVIYENGSKRYNDEIFEFDGHNGVMLLENGGGKTVFIQTALQAIIPHTDMAERKIKDTLSLDSAPAHIAIEWILNEQPRRYATTATTLFIENNQLNSIKYTYDYGAGDSNSIENMPFSLEIENQVKRPATRGEMNDYYQRMTKQSMNAKLFSTILAFGNHIEREYKIIPSEWRKVAVINSAEGNVDEFFSKCKTTEQLLNNLLIPVVEEAIEGDHKTTFVDTFEKQREHFKKNRILHDKIEQSQRIKLKLDAYVDVFGNYEEERLAIHEIKREARTLTNYITHQIDTKKNDLNYNEANRLRLEQEYKDHAQKKTTYELLLLEEALEVMKKEYDGIKNELDRVQKEYDFLGKRKQNIEICNLERDLRQSETQIKILEKELDFIDADIDISDIKAQMNENNAHIKGYFSYELELIERELLRIGNEKNMESEQLKKIKVALENAKSYEKDLIEMRSGIKTRYEIALCQKEDIKKILFDNREEMDASVYLNLLKKTCHDIEKVLLQKKAEIMALSGKNQENKTTLLERKEALKVIVRNLEKYKETEGNIQSEMRYLIQSVEATGKNLYISNNIYGKEETILGELEEQRLYAESQKEEALREERAYFHLADIYENTPYFIAEPQLAQIVESLKSQTDFVELGTKHLQIYKDSLELDELTLYNKYPYWAITIVTSSQDEKKVIEHMDRMGYELSSMILVITIENLNKWIEEEHNLFDQNPSKPLFPKTWSSNLKHDQYYIWQQNILSEAYSYQNSRKDAEKSLKEKEKLLDLAMTFFNKYPYEAYNALNNSIVDGENEKRAIESEQEALIEKIQTNEHHIDILNDEIYQHKVVMESNQEQMSIVEKWIEAEEALVHIGTQLDEVNKSMEDLLSRIEVYQKTIDQHNQRLKLLEVENHSFTREKDKILDNGLYIEVQDIQAICANIGFDVLKEQKAYLEKKLAGMGHSRMVLEERIMNEKKQKEKYQKSLTQKRREMEYDFEPIDISYEDELKDLFNQMKAHYKVLDRLKNDLNLKEMNLGQIKTRREITLNNLLSEYSCRYAFNIALNLIPNQLKSELSNLKEREKKLNIQKNKIEEEMHTFEQILRELQVKDGTYHYMMDGIEPLMLELDYFEAFDQDAIFKVNQLMSALSGQSVIVEKALNQVRKEKEDLKQYCQEHIEDYRLKDMVIKGLESKDDYDGLVHYQEKMTEIILKIIKVAEDDKRESDTELQTFLSHLLMYVRHVSTELGDIQNKTRIKVGEGYKQIFIFDIPKWEDDEGKNMLRTYINETIEAYEKESEQGEHDEVLLRKSIEERLSVKNLLKVIMKENTIKIKCRKVTNDMQINKAPMVWESTNKWSGGEKWSKNMTLFLSLLNYMAEKKQHLDVHQKKQRAVILDNPFGKASSDHVLKPVFMIAEKLGFQIIALTAHAEGKFISEYFPVVYSCKLREAKATNKQIMTNERIINYAYLREHAPMTIMRMQEIEQLNLFESI
ncbi:hypothetical protein [Petrocella sp. FN5]|uniref:hypothetical protein n=1 Tax=Petrocella sp. FN5 TaxID=3032002 RepID=UPI0023DA3743|nr:hypothetical protein [Petrocella sp. FN5]MDF1616234.1 hypothetical protein [Petrocella sp. FN5]